MVSKEVRKNIYHIRADNRDYIVRAITNRAALDIWLDYIGFEIHQIDEDDVLAKELDDEDIVEYC